MPLDPGTETDFRYELARILGSSTFNSAAKQRDLIKWLVEQTLTASEPSFSQFEIATQALGYKDSFDSTSDSRVRTAMRRLREKLATYYQTEGRMNRFRIVIEDGKYAPELVRPKPLLSPGPSRSVLPTLSDKLSVMVLPVLPIGFRDEQCFCDGLTLNLMRAIAAGGQARVVPWTTSHWLAEKPATSANTTSRQMRM